MAAGVIDATHGQDFSEAGLKITVHKMGGRLYRHPYESQNHNTGTCAMVI